MLKELGIGVICAQKHTSMGTPQGQGKTGQIDVGRVMSHMKYVVASLEQNVRPNGARGPGGRGGTAITLGQRDSSLWAIRLLVAEMHV